MGIEQKIPTGLPDNHWQVYRMMMRLVDYFLLFLQGENLEKRRLEINNKHNPERNISFPF